MPRSYALGDHFEGFIDAQVTSGRFNNASEVVRAGLRLLKDAERPSALTLDDLRQLIRDGAESGQSIPADQVFRDLKARYADAGGGKSA